MLPNFASQCQTNGGNTYGVNIKLDHQSPAQMNGVLKI